MTQLASVRVVKCGCIIRWVDRSFVLCVPQHPCVRGEGGGGPYHLPGPGGRAGMSRLVLICCKGVDRHFLYL